LTLSRGNEAIHSVKVSRGKIDNNVSKDSSAASEAENKQTKQNVSIYSNAMNTHCSTNEK
jgi:hypothetical protein